MRVAFILFFALALPLASCDSTPDPCEIRGDSPATIDSRVSIDYRGQFASGQVFDERFCFVQDASQFFPGLRNGIIGMVPGEEKTYTVAPEDVFGDEGGEIEPPTQSVTFFVRLRSAEDGL